jgi:catechol 2,3-dioxygenase-like lactoylglutathione lyase family enzyme
MALVLGIDHVQLAAPAGCEAEARAFFCGLLGLRELSKPAALAGQGGCWFETGPGTQLHIGIEEPFSPAKKAHPAFSVADADAAFSALEHAGVECIWGDDAIAGVRRFFAQDPWGNRLEFTTAGAK